MSTQELDLTKEEPPTLGRGVPIAEGREQPFDPDKEREETRGDLARGLLWLLTFAIGGVLAFIGLGRLDGTVLTQSIFPSLVALAGTALGFYFGSHSPVTLPVPGGGGGATQNPAPTVVVAPVPTPTTPTPGAAQPQTGNEVPPPAQTGAQGGAATMPPPPGNAATGAPGVSGGASQPGAETTSTTSGGAAEGASTGGAGGAGTGAAGAGEIEKEEEVG